LQLCLGKSEDKEERGKNQKIDLDMKISKLKRYIFSNLESGVHEAYWIDILCSMQSFECFDMLLIGFTYCIICLFRFNECQNDSKEDAYFLLLGS
jgi:hypothetical protein